ncbi:MAG: hypothetical protein IJJ04_04240 [Clostridia bacterium]|nr:hypothetical protein [Clostridia bacterium]
MENKNKISFALLVGIIASLVTIASVVASILIIIDKKKKREEKELDEYLEASIL